MNGQPSRQGSAGVGSGDQESQLDSASEIRLFDGAPHGAVPGDRLADGSPPDRLDPTVAYLAATLARFNEAMAGLREVVEIATTHIGAADDATPEARAERTIRDLPPQRQAEVRRAVEQIVAAVGGALNPAAWRPPTGSEAGPLGQPMAEFAMAALDLSKLDSSLRAFAAEHAVDDQELGVAVLAYTRAWYRVPRLSGVLSPVLVMAVSAFETLLTAAWRHWLSRHPEAAELASKTVPAAQLWEHEDLDVLRNRVLTDTIDGWVRAGPEQWPRLLKGRCGIALERLAIDWPAALEAFLRRNAIVHANSEADRAYIQHLPGSAPRPPLGASLAVDATYLAEVLDRLEGLGPCVLAAFATKLGPVPTRFALQGVSGLVTLALAQERWRLGEQLATGLLPLVSASEDSWRLRVDAWIARSKMGQKAEVRKEVEASGLAAAGPLFALAAHVLTGAVEPAEALIPQLMEEGLLAFADLGQWPLFADLRAQPGWLARFMPLDPGTPE